MEINHGYLIEKWSRHTKELHLFGIYICTVSNVAILMLHSAIALIGILCLALSITSIWIPIVYGIIALIIREAASIKVTNKKFIDYTDSDEVAYYFDNIYLAYNMGLIKYVDVWPSFIAITIESSTDSHTISFRYDRIYEDPYHAALLRFIHDKIHQNGKSNEENAADSISIYSASSTHSNSH